jgi:hypothetical protein
MDADLEGALTLIHEQYAGEVDELLNAASRVYQEAEGDTFEDFKRAFLDLGFGGAAQELVSYAEANGGLQFVQRMHEAGASNLTAEYQSMLEAGAANLEDFAAYLQEYSAYWTGDEESWATFTDAVQEHAEQTFGEPAEEFFARAAAGEDKLALLEEYGVTVEENLDEFKAYLEQYSAYWDGDEESWTAFTDTVQEYAEETFGAAASTFFARAQTEDKVALFQEYGVTIQSGEESVAAMFESLEEQIQAFEDQARASDAIPDEHVATVSMAFDELANEDPALVAGLTPREMEELLQKVAPHL